MDTLYVYIIYSTKLDRFYVGYSSDLNQRLIDHNSGISSFTSKANDWILRWSKLFPTRNEAHQFELLIKKKKSRSFLVYLIQSNLNSNNLID